MKKRNITKANIIKRNKTLKPETKIMEIQVAKSKTVCPKSGWNNRSKVMIERRINEIKCEYCKFLIRSEAIIWAITNIKNEI